MDTQLQLVRTDPTGKHNKPKQQGCLEARTNTFGRGWREGGTHQASGQTSEMMYMYKLYVNIKWRSQQ